MDKNEFQELLSKTGLNKRELAELVGIPYATVNGWGSKVPYPPYARFLLEAVIKIQTLEKVVKAVEPILKDKI
ncbi:XRE family transcriptional regulator [uncultured Campylobacter sp.]|uniref:XRE family transcriptional regulator n=1 Tax=uncultured Campylobacter sp. TaxID=218934 RepID=UPI0028E2F79E|nr:XRE family transcriptional regulator [uncultured Campylobacter sp.]